MKKAIFTVVASLCTLFAAEAMAQDSVAVMKLDVSNASVESQSALVLDALHSEVTNSDLTLDANGSDITYTEMQMLTGCDRDASIACYEAACETLGSHAIIFGNVAEDGNTNLVWYVSGKGIFREVSGVVTDKDSADKLAQRMVVGEMGTLVVTSNIPGADVFIDGKRVGMSAEFIENAQPLTLLAGNYIVSVRKEGYEREDAVKVEVKGGEQAHINIDLTVAIDTDKMQDTLKYAGWATFGVGVAGLIAGGALGIVTKTKNDEMNDKISKGESSGISDLNDKGDKYALSTNILLGVGGVATVAGIALICVGYLYNFESDEALAAGIPSVNVAASPEYSGLQLGWKF